jgi:hypothetical protein
MAKKLLVTQLDTLLWWVRALWTLPDELELEAAYREAALDEEREEEAHEWCEALIGDGFTRR